MAVMPIYGKNIAFFIRNRMAEDLEIWYAPFGYSGSTQSVQMVTRRLPLLILQQGQIWSVGLEYVKKAKL